MRKHQPAPRDALMPESEIDMSETIEKQKKEKKEEPMASVSETLSFVFGCGPKIRLTFIIGCIAGIGNGLVQPALAWIFSSSFSSIAGASDGLKQVREIAYIFLGIGVYGLIAAMIQNACFDIVAYNASRAFRLQWFKALLRQDIAYFDVYDISGIAATIGPNSNKYKRGLGSKFGEFLQFSTNFVGGLVFAFYSSWQVALVVLAVLPIVGLTGLAAVQINQTKSTSAAAAYSKAGSIAYSTVSAIKTVLSLNAIPEMIRQYSEATLEAFKQAEKLLLKAGLANGSMLGSFILLYCILTLFGTFLIWRDVDDTGCDPSDSVPDNSACPQSGPNVFGAMLGVAFAAQGVSQTGNFFGIFTQARVACHAALNAINRKVGSPEMEIYEEERQDEEDTEDESDIEIGGKEKKLRAILPGYDIDSSSPYGLKPPKPRGAISFRDVGFHYLTRPSENILDGFNLEIEAGKTVALVGASGGGKSTTVAMIERYYDPQVGSVSLDGINLKDINVHYLRSLIGYVGQEPTLFATTIAGNIKYGRPDATQEHIEAAARMANAHDFISSFPDGYFTQVGDKGAQLSGGQKQRIAIARVLIANPRILLLDEATSALDSESELVVQEALDNVLAEHKRTTIVIAHRLSTIRNADKIAVVFGGKVVEQGTHDELMARGSGQYRKLVETQDRKPATRSSLRGSVVSSREGSTVVSRRLSLDLQELHEIELEVKESVDALATPHFEFKDVCFSYPTRPKKTILDDFYFRVRKGETVGLVGPSGGGKSTVISMIERFYDPTSGCVEYNGVDIRSLNLKWYRDQIGYVGQEPVLFSASIAKNIAYGAPGATREDIEEAAKHANAYDFIMSFPNGFDTEVGERGTQLSGGQKQRVAIARALVKKPAVILLDEATSALDSESEAIVQEALDKLMESKDHTTIVIAHRLSTLSGVDRIAFIADGVVKETGSHDELMQMDHGRYKRLFEAQTRRASTAIMFGGSSQSNVGGDDELEKPDFDAEIEEAEKNAFDAKRARQMAQPDAIYMLIGSIGAIIAGGVFPAWGIMFGETINLLFRRIPSCEVETSDGVPCDVYYDSEAASMREDSFVLGGYWVAIAVGCVVGNLLTFYGFGMASERLNKRVRDSAFTALVRQEVAFYDKRSVGSITAQLEDDAARIHTFSGEPIRSLLTAVSSMVIGLVVSFVFMWPFALLAICCIPVMGAATSVHMKKMMGEDGIGENGQDELNSPGGIAVETLLNIRTVAALILEKERYTNYRDALEREQPHYVRDCVVGGFSSGMSMAVQQWVNALQLWWGGWILFNYPTTFTFDGFLISMFSLLFSLFGLGAAFQGVSDKKETEASAGRIFYLLDRKSEIDPMSEEGKKLD